MSRIFFDRDLDTVAAYWRIHRKDGVTLGFTTHDRDIWFGGVLHRAAPGMLPSAIRKSIDLADDEAEVEGALGHDTIRPGDLATGRFDGARVETGVIDWETLESASLYSGSIGSVRQDAAGFSAQLQSAKADLEIDPVPRASPSCRARFCGPGCTLSSAAFTIRSTVVSVDLLANTVQLDLANHTAYSLGELRFLDGPQTGLVMRIVAERSGKLELDQLLDPATAVGQRVLLREGCDKTVATCASRFANAINFQGEPFLPGNDLLAQYPQPR
ncbi:DUF2163 domain-containing protein [Qipengyuania gelatinilytica]|uniref:DUF2163 domain-containing protein n=1 Tax=Qipengyuania gelatinilytica TaxID=2867231 RepID=A0ABX8ZZQ3_9SPHN|nr:DUF2163 domain-containing protein [Qipengyuania gelatinilytica]QZD94317.1 DUF2163 domain-containing protein [Qipengyuania gelatinilytica]